MNIAPVPVHGCMRCGGDHLLEVLPLVDLRSDELKRAKPERWTHYMTCPETGAPIMATVFAFQLTEAGREMGERLIREGDEAFERSVALGESI